MKIRVLGFGIVKEIFRGSEILFDMEAGKTTEELKHALEIKYPALKELNSFMVAINNQYAQQAQLINSSDEIAIIPPVSGG